MLKTLFHTLLLFGLVACRPGSTADPSVNSSDATPPLTERQQNPAANSASEEGRGESEVKEPANAPSPPKEEIATLGAGCYWCTEAVLEQLDGVLDVQSGFMGGQVANPSYKEVCTGKTGHAEVVQVRFDPSVISYEALLEWFWRLHDPTSLNRQGADVGTQYRSVIFVHSPEQREVAERSKAAAQEHFKDPIVTEITDAGPFYPAEDYHQNYYRTNKTQGYCRMVIAPKLEKLGLDH